MELYMLIKPLGIITYIFLLLTLSRVFIKWKTKHHKIFALITLFFATLHVVIVYISD